VLLNIEADRTLCSFNSLTSSVYNKANLALPEFLDHFIENLFRSKLCKIVNTVIGQFEEVRSKVSYLFLVSIALRTCWLSPHSMKSETINLHI